VTPKGLRWIAIALPMALATLQAHSATRTAATHSLIKPPLLEDPRKAVIQDVVRSRYPELFSASAAPGFAVVTLAMTPAGAFDKGFRDETQPKPYITSRRKAFEAMGADATQYGDRVQLDMRGGPAGATRIYVRAYLPKSASAGDGPWPPAAEGPAAPNDDPAVDRAIAEKFFPDLYTYTTPDYQSVADFWVLLDRAGSVRATGRRYALGHADLELYLESLYPGIRTDGFQPVELRSDHGRPAVVNFLWLAADSPVTDLTRADLSKRADVALYANIAGDGSTAETSLAVLAFGSPSVVVCDDKDLDLQVTATAGGAGTVLLRARIQHVARLAPAEFEFGRPNAVESAWRAATLPVRVRYGESAKLQLTDQEHHTWTVSLHPDRMRGTLAGR
jgi:hypothetical protein